MITESPKNEPDVESTVYSIGALEQKHASEGVSIQTSENVGTNEKVLGYVNSVLEAVRYLDEHPEQLVEIE